MLAFAAPFGFALAIPALYYGAGPWSPVLSVVALLAALLAAEFLSPRGAAQAATRGGHFLLPRFYVAVQLAVIAWATLVAGTLGIGPFLGLALATGVTTGVFGVLAAHELVHGRRQRWLGTLMLTGMSYRHFRTAHIHGHHRWAGTVHDSATARPGENFYRFLLRTVPGQFAEAWRFESRRGLAKNRVLRDLAATIALYLAIALACGWRGLGFFVLQCAIGIVVLELFNYIAHYGLMRGATDAGMEPFGDRHSWNSSNVLANHLIFNMGRHSAHHTRPAASFETLHWAVNAPELPMGYAGSIVLALVPPMWRRIMDPAVQSLHTDSRITSG
ncbi:MAG: alkane 1-monooxygenase [Proteobacteria bacterium]|nr:alkane 1-monooxygenase [Pseudomonadota bacterium]